MSSIGSSQWIIQSTVMQYVEICENAETKRNNVLLRIRTIIGQLTLQAKAIQTPEELCQAAPNPSLWVPVCISSFLKIFRRYYIHIDRTRTDDEGPRFYLTTN